MELIMKPRVSELLSVFNENYRLEFPEDFSGWDPKTFTLWFINVPWFKKDLLIALSVNGSIEGFIFIDDRAIKSKGIAYFQGFCVKARSRIKKFVDTLLNIAELKAKELGAHAVKIHLRESSPLLNFLISRNYIVVNKWYKMSLDLRKIKYHSIMCKRRNNSDIIIKPYINNVDDDLLIYIHNNVFKDEEDFIPLNKETLSLWKRDPNWLRTKIYFAVLKNGEVVGYVAYVRRRSGKALIDSLGVIKNYRGKGIGNTLLSYVLNELKWYCNEAYLYTTSSNKAAINLYTKAGFKINYVGLTLQKSLSNVTVKATSLKPEVP